MLPKESALALPVKLLDYKQVEQMRVVPHGDCSNHYVIFMANVILKVWRCHDFCYRRGFQARQEPLCTNATWLNGEKTRQTLNQPTNCWSITRGC